MAKAASLTTKVSSKGQIVLPKAIRDRRGWAPGAELVIEDLPEGVLLRPAPKEKPTRFEDVAGSLGPFARTVSIEEMHQALLDEAARRFRRAVDDRD